MDFFYFGGGVGGPEDSEKLMSPNYIFAWDTSTYRKDRDVQLASQAWAKQAQALVLVCAQDLLKHGKRFNREV